MISLQAFLLCLFVFPSLPLSYFCFPSVQGWSSAGTLLQGLAGHLAARCPAGHFTDTLQPWHPLCKFCFWPAGLHSAVLDGGIWAPHWGKSWALGVVPCCDGLGTSCFTGCSTPGVRPGCTKQAGVLDTVCHWTKAGKFGFNPLLQISWSCQDNAHSSMYSSFFVAVYVAKGTAGSRSTTALKLICYISVL